MKVLLCSYYKGTVGGISRWTHHILDYYGALEDKTEIVLDIFSLSRSRDIHADTSVAKRLFFGLSDYMKIVKNFKKIISKENYDIVHLVSSASFGLVKDLIILYLAKKFSLKSVIHFRFGRIPQLYQHNNWERRLLHRVVNSATKVIVIDKTSYNTLVEYGYQNIIYLPNPINQSVLDFVSKNRNIIKEPSKILFAGHVVKSKGVFELIEATKEIKGISVDVIGYVSDDTRRELIKKAGDNPYWLNIKGEMNYENTLKHMLSAGVFVLPTYTEGFPNVILESMACACPIVTTKVGAIPEMLDIDGKGDCGICIEPKNVKDLESAIKKMLSNVDYARTCGENAYARVVQKYSMPKIWGELETIWYSLK